MATAAAARRVVPAVQELEVGQLTVASAPTAGRWYDVAALLDRFHRRYPGVDIRLESGTAHPVLARVRDGSVDVALVSVPEPLPEGLVATVVTTAPYVAAVPAGHPLAVRRTVRPAALAPESFIDLDPSMAIRQSVDAMFAAAGVRRSVSFEVGTLDLALELVRRRLGVTCIPAPHDTREEGVACVPLSGGQPPWRFGAVTAAAGVTRATASLMALLHDDPAAVPAR